MRLIRLTNWWVYLHKKTVHVEDPRINDLEDIGTVAKIVKLIKMPDGGTTVIIQGRKRFQIEAITSEDPYFKARIRSYWKKQTIVDDQHFDATLVTLKDLAAQIIQLSPNIPAEASIILRNIENPSFLIHFVSSNLNSDIHEKQQLLEMNDMKAGAE